MPKPIMDLWVTSSSDEEEDEQPPSPPPPKSRKSKKQKSEPPKAITKTTKVKPSKRITRRNDIEDEDEDESDHVSIERESNARNRDSKNRGGRETRDLWSDRDRDYGRPSTNRTSKTSITKITPINESYKAPTATDESLQSSIKKESIQNAFVEGARYEEDPSICSWIDIKCILFFIFIVSATSLGFIVYLFIIRLNEMKTTGALSETTSNIAEVDTGVVALSDGGGGDSGGNDLVSTPDELDNSDFIDDDDVTPTAQPTTTASPAEDVTTTAAAVETTPGGGD